MRLRTLPDLFTLNLHTFRLTQFFKKLKKNVNVLKMLPDIVLARMKAQ